MTSTSSEPVVLRQVPVGSVAALDTGRDLRDGAWTRLGSGSVLGDAVTESTLAGLAERSRDAARAQGYAAGWAQGRRAAELRADDEHQSLVAALQAQAALAGEAQRGALAALQAAAARCAETTQQLQDDLTARTLDLALEIVEAVLGREVAHAAPGVDALRRVLLAAPVDVPLLVRLHPDDLAALDEEVAAELAGGRSLRLVADASLARGDAVAETGAGLVDATLGAALARVREVLCP